MPSVTMMAMTAAVATTTTVAAAMMTTSAATWAPMAAMMTAATSVSVMTAVMTTWTAVTAATSTPHPRLFQTSLLPPPGLDGRQRRLHRHQAAVPLVLRPAVRRHGNVLHLPRTALHKSIQRSTRGTPNTLRGNRRLLRAHHRVGVGGRVIEGLVQSLRRTHRHALLHLLRLLKVALERVVLRLVLHCVPTPIAQARRPTSLVLRHARRQCAQCRRHLLLARLEELHQLEGELPVLLRQQRQRRAGGRAVHRAAGPTDPVDVNIHVIRSVEIHHYASHTVFLSHPCSRRPRPVRAPPRPSR